MIIDSHTHIFSYEVIENRECFIDDKSFNLLYSSQKAKLIGHTELLHAMSKSQIDYAIVLGYPWEKEEYCELQNNYFKDVMELSNGKIRPFASVPMNDANAVYDHVKQIKEMGIPGIGEIAFYSGGFSKKYEKILTRIFESASEYNLPVNLHVNETVGHSYPGKYNTDFNRLYSIIDDFKDLTLILAHWGGGILFYELMPEVQESFKNVYYDTAASPYLYSNRIYDIASRIVGPGKILFGTDYPLIGFDRYIKEIKSCIDDEEDRNMILGSNAMKILKIK